MMLKNVYNGKPADYDPNKVTKKPVPEQTLLGVFGEFIVRFGKLVDKGLRSDGTLKHWNTLRSHVVDFLSYQYGVTDLRFAEIDGMFADDFYDYLTIYKEKTLAEVTARREAKWTRQILKIGVKKGFIKNNPMDGFKCSGGDK